MKAAAALPQEGAVQEGKEKNNRESILLQTNPRAKHSFLRMKNPLPHPVGAHKSRKLFDDELHKRRKKPRKVKTWDFCQFVISLNEDRMPRSREEIL